MKCSKIYVVLMVAIASIPAYLHAQVSFQLTSIDIDAKVIAPITLENTANTALDFGTVSRSSTSGTVTVPTSGNRTTTGGVAVFGTNFSPAPFTVSGENNSTFNITLPANGTVFLHNGSNTMAVNSFAHNQGATPTLSAAGTASFLVGATLSVGADQVAGIYSGSFSVTVAYQ